MATARDCIAKEILQTETYYVESLKTTIQVFINPLKLAIEKQRAIISQEQLTKLFSNIETLVTVNSELLSHLQEVIQVNWNESQSIGRVFLDMAPFLKCYTQYCNFFEESNQVLNQLESNARFKRFLKKAVKLPECKNLGLDSFLIMPVQRIPRYILLLKDLFKHTPPSHVDYIILAQSLTAMEEVASGVNNSVAKFQRNAKLISIEQELNIHIGLVQPNRIFISEQTLPCKIEKREFTNVKIYLLNDLLLFSCEGRYVDRAAIYMVWVTDGDPDLPNSFTLFCPTATDFQTYLFNANTPEEKNEFVTILDNTIRELLVHKPSYGVARTKKLEETENKKKVEKSMSATELKRYRKIEKKSASKRKLTRDDSKFQTIKF